MQPSNSELNQPAESQVSIKSRLRSRTKTAFQVHNATSITFTPLTEFLVFSKLPPELQLMIWNEAHFPRIVTLKPGRSQIPPLLHACRDSRRECIKAGYKVAIRDMSTGFIMSPWQDILLLDRNSFSDSMSYHINSIHTLRCKSINRPMFKPIQKLALTVDEIVRIWNQECIHCFFMGKLQEWFPNVKELIILLRHGPLGATYDDLYQVTDSKPLILQSYISDIKKQFEYAQKDDSLQGVELKFMRNEKWIT